MVDCGLLKRSTANIRYISRTTKIIHIAWYYFGMKWFPKNVFIINCCILENVVFYVRREVGLLSFNANFNNISVISWRSVLLAGEIGVPGEKHRPVASNWLDLTMTGPLMCTRVYHSQLAFAFVSHSMHFNCFFYQIQIDDIMYQLNVIL